MSQSYSRTPASSTDATTPLASTSTSTSTQDYFHQTHAVNSPAGWKGGSTQELHDAERMREMEEHAQRFADGRDRLVESINDTSSLLTDLRDFSKRHWIVNYPALDRKPMQKTAPRRSIRRAQSVAPDGHLESDGSNDDDHHDHHQSHQHPGLHRSSTDAVVAHSAPNTPMKQAPRGEHNDDDDDEIAIVHDDDDDQPQQNEMSVLRLDLKLGAAGHNNPQALVRTLEKSSVAQLLDERMTTSIRQLDSLRNRISDTQSKVLVTGDLNAGKSTFVNALMRRKLMPVDQQPCTTVFCEVLDAEQANEGREEVHLVHPGMSYDVQNDNTYTRHTLEDIERIVAEAEDVNPEDAPMLKCYCHDTRATQESLLRNGIVDIALIDAPGLNRDSLKTTALFARQEQIDVVVFVVSAENHFTLSAKEFLWNASNDKAYIFIVVNKFDQIRNKDKCKRLVLDQIKQLSPRTYEDADELVHFVDSDSVGTAHTAVETPTEERKVAGDVAVDEKPTPPQASVSFTQLEACLRDFVLQRREKSKLLPAQTYLLRLLSDIEFLASTNLGVANAELQEARRQLEVARPALAECQAARNKMEARLEGEEDSVVSDILHRTQQDLRAAEDLIGEGYLASDKITMPPYMGLWRVQEYAAALRAAFVESLAARVDELEESARQDTQLTVTRIKELGESFLPSDVEPSKRVFVPEVMFQKRVQKRRNNKGVARLGLTPDILEARATDILDAPHYFAILTNAVGRHGSKDKSVSQHLEDEVSLLTGASLGFGVLTVFSNKVWGAKTALDAFVHFSNFCGNSTVRRWGPVVVMAGVAVVCVQKIRQLPQTMRCNVGRSVKEDMRSMPRDASSSKALTMRDQSRNSTTISPDDDDDEAANSTWTMTLMGWTTTQADAILDGKQQSCTSLAEMQSSRISREVRKVIRLAGYDIQEQFRSATAKRAHVVTQLEGKEATSGKAIEWFTETTGRIDGVRHNVEAVKIA